MKRLPVKRWPGLAALPLLLLAGSLAVSLAITGCAHPQPPPYYPPPPPPPPLPVIVRQGFHDGVAAARFDISRGLPPAVERHARFRNPPEPPGEPAHAYRVNFRRGYFATYGQ